MTKYKDRKDEYRKVTIVTYYRYKRDTNFKDYKATRLVLWMIINLNKLDEQYIKFKTIPERWKIYRSKNKFTPFKTYIEETKVRDKYPYYNQKKKENINL